MLTENFTDVINVEFTAKIEDEFDEIADGKEPWKKMIRNFYGPFEKEIEKVQVIYPKKENCEYRYESIRI